MAVISGKPYMVFQHSFSVEKYPPKFISICPGLVPDTHRHKESSNLHLVPIERMGLQVPLLPREKYQVRRNPALERIRTDPESFSSGRCTSHALISRINYVELMQDGFAAVGKPALLSAAHGSSPHESLTVPAV